MAYVERDGSRKVPSWDGSPQHWTQYCIDFDWFVAGKPRDKRPYIVGRLVQALPAGLVKTLVQSWRASAFETPTGHEKYIEKLSASPLMKRPLPQAQVQMGKFYAYQRRNGQSMGDYLIGEDKVYRDYILLHRGPPLGRG